MVEEALKVNADRDKQRRAQECAYRFMSAVAGNAPGYEDALRALFAKDRTRFSELLSRWPTDIAAFAMNLADPAFPSAAREPV